MKSKILTCAIAMSLFAALAMPTELAGQDLIVQSPPKRKASTVPLVQLKAALLQWYRQDFLVGGSPEGVAFDGTNIWVAVNSDNAVTKLRARDGDKEGTFAVGSSPIGVALDGLEKIYNQKRLHSALGYRPPREFEQSLALSSRGARGAVA